MSVSSPILLITINIKKNSYKTECKVVIHNEHFHVNVLHGLEMESHLIKAICMHLADTQNIFVSPFFKKNPGKWFSQLHCIYGLYERSAAHFSLVLLVNSVTQLFVYSFSWTNSDIVKHGDLILRI